MSDHDTQNHNPDIRAQLLDLYTRLANEPGGSIQIADMVRDPSASNSACCDGKASWADCVSGTLHPDVFLDIITRAGFHDAELAGLTSYRTSPGTIGALFRSVKPG